MIALTRDGEEMTATEMYFRTYATENEHFIIAGEMTDYCKANDVKLHYYRLIKTGHIPLYREVKISGKRGDLLKLRTMWDYCIDERWRLEK